MFALRLYDYNIWSLGIIIDRHACWVSGNPQWILGGTRPEEGLRLKRLGEI